MTTISELEERLIPLRKMGLTQYQVKVYAGLISLGYTTAYQISYVTKVPYPKVYSTLDYLKEKGLVEESRGRPKRFRAKPPMEAITTLQEGFVRNLKTSVKDAISELKTVYSTVDLTEERGVWNIVGRRNVLSQMKGLLRASKERALMVFPEIGKISPEGLTPILKELKRRQIPVRIMTSQGDKKAVACYKGLADTRFIQGVENRYVIVDDSVLHIFLSKSDLGTDSWSAIWSTHKNCLKRSVEYFEHVWKYGRPRSRLMIGECPSRMLQIMAGITQKMKLR